MKLTREQEIEQEKRREEGLKFLAELAREEEAEKSRGTDVPYPCHANPTASVAPTPINTTDRGEVYMGTHEPTMESKLTSPARSKLFEQWLAQGTSPRHPYAVILHKPQPSWRDWRPCDPAEHLPNDDPGEFDVWHWKGAFWEALLLAESQNQYEIDHSHNPRVWASVVAFTGKRSTTPFNPRLASPIEYAVYTETIGPCDWNPQSLIAAPPRVVAGWTMTGPFEFFEDLPSALAEVLKNNAQYFYRRIKGDNLGMNPWKMLVAFENEPRSATLAQFVSFGTDDGYAASSVVTPFHVVTPIWLEAFRTAPYGDLFDAALMSREAGEGNGPIMDAAVRAIFTDDPPADVQANGSLVTSAEIEHANEMVNARSACVHHSPAAAEQQPGPLDPDRMVFLRNAASVELAFTAPTVDYAKAFAHGITFARSLVLTGTPVLGSEAIRAAGFKAPPLEAEGVAR